jgi:hypothetical protein
MTPKNEMGEENKSQTPSAGGATLEKNEKKIHWSEENETILVEWCDIAQCYKWLYTRSHSKYAAMHAWFTIPTIIFSTISGTASFAQASLPMEYQSYATLGIGSINIFIGIFATIQQYLKISELNEAHRVSAISWDKFARNIRIELAKAPEERNDAGSFIKLCRLEFDRLMETSPRIPDETIDKFLKTFRGTTQEEIDNFKKLKKPDICDTIITANETRHKWYLQTNKATETIDNVDTRERGLSFDSISENTPVKPEFSNIALTRLKDIRSKKGSDKGLTNVLRTLEEVEQDDKKNRKQEEEKKQQEEDEKVKHAQREQLEKIERYIAGFNNLYERRPLKEEVYEGTMNEVNKEVLDTFLKTYG